MRKKKNFKGKIHKPGIQVGEKVKRSNKNRFEVRTERDENVKC